MSRQPTVPQPDLPHVSRIVELDALRGLAAVAVVLFHYTTRYQQLFGHPESLAVSLPWGQYGVDLFFMLSGFVILMTLERTAESWKFAWGRFSRLYPTYWAAAALTFVVVSAFGLPGQEVSVGEALVNLTMVQALLGAPHIDGAYWSLQAELIFYGNMLVLYRLGAFQRPAVTVVCWLALACGVHLAQSYAVTAWPLGAALLSKLATIGSLKFIPLFGIGVLFYAMQRAERSAESHCDGKSLKLSRVGLIGCLVAVGCWEGLATLWIDALLAALLWLAIRRRLPMLASRPLIWLGAISYSLYLTHQNIGYVLIRNLESQGIGPLTAIAIAGAGALCLGNCLHRWVERPSMQLLRKVDFASFPRRVETVGANS
jgi:peptidoglycan/LPS O-acetylase OafA/YrhL